MSVGKFTSRMNIIGPNLKMLNNENEPSFVTVALVEK